MKRIIINVNVNNFIFWTTMINKSANNVIILAMYIFPLLFKLPKLLCLMRIIFSYVFMRVRKSILFYINSIKAGFNLRYYISQL